MFFLKLCTNDYMTAMYPTWGHVSPSWEHFEESCYLKMYIKRVGLVRFLQPWDILLIYCNNQLKEYIAPLPRLVRGTLSATFWCLCQKLLLSSFTLIKLCYKKALEWSSLVPGSEAKSSSLKITNPTSFTVSYLYTQMSMHTDTFSPHDLFFLHVTFHSLLLYSN